MGNRENNKYLNEQKLIWEKNREMISYGNSDPLLRIRLSIRISLKGSVTLYFFVFLPILFGDLELISV